MDKLQCVAQLGDALPYEYGGAWVLVDPKGEQEPTLIIWTEPEEDGEKGTQYTIVLERCFFTKGVLSENPYHPLKPAWFAKGLKSVAKSCGMDVKDLIAQLCSADPVQRAHGYLTLTGYYGAHEFDQYPERMTIAEMRALMRNAENDLAKRGD